MLILHNKNNQKENRLDNLEFNENDYSNYLQKKKNGVFNTNI